jgi:Eukaryotic protein of unknown function (DUF1764)
MKSTTVKAKVKAEKLAIPITAVNEKKRGTEDIDNIFDTLKQSKKSNLAKVDEVQSLANSIPSSDGVSADQPKATTKVLKMKSASQESSSLPHGVVKSNNPRIIISPEAPVERIDPESGYKVYKAHILKVGEGGGTDLCPFDCDCCF